MAAVPYKVSMIAALGKPTGQRKIFSMTSSDVNGEFWLHQSGANELVLNGSNDVWIVDTIYSAAGTDTSQAEFFVNGASTGVKLLNATSTGTIVARPLQSAPLLVQAGSMVKVIQRT